MLDRFRHLLDYTQNQGDVAANELGDSEGQQASTKPRPSATGRSISLRESSDNESTATTSVGTARSISLSTSRQSSLSERLNLSHDSATLRSISSMLLASKRFFTTNETDSVEDEGQEANTSNMSTDKTRIRSNGSVAASASVTSDSASDAEVETSTSSSMFKRLQLIAMKAQGSLASSLGRGQTSDDEGVTAGDADAIIGDKKAHVNGANGHSSIDTSLSLPAKQRRMKDGTLSPSSPSHITLPVDEYMQITLASTSVTEDYLQFVSQSLNEERVNNFSRSDSKRLRTRRRSRKLSGDEHHELVYWVDERYLEISSLDKVCSNVDVIQEQTVMVVNIQPSKHKHSEATDDCEASVGDRIVDQTKSHESGKQEVALQLLQDLIGKGAVNRAEVVYFMPGKYRSENCFAQQDVIDLDEKIIAQEASGELEAENKLSPSPTHNHELALGNRDGMTTTKPYSAEHVEVIDCMDGRFIKFEPVLKATEDDNKSMSNCELATEPEATPCVTENVEVIDFIDDRFINTEPVTDADYVDNDAESADVQLYDEVTSKWPGKVVVGRQETGSNSNTSASDTSSSSDDESRKPKSNVVETVDISYFLPGLYCERRDDCLASDQQSTNKAILNSVLEPAWDAALLSEENSPEDMLLYEDIVYTWPGKTASTHRKSDVAELEEPVSVIRSDSVHSKPELEIDTITPRNNEPTIAVTTAAEKVFVESLNSERTDLVEIYYFMPGFYTVERTLVENTEINVDSSSDNEGTVFSSIVESAEIIDLLPGMYFNEIMLPHENEEIINADIQSLNGESCTQLPLATLHTEELSYLPGLFFSEILMREHEDRSQNSERQSRNGDSCVSIPLATLHTEEYDSLPGLYFNEMIIPHESQVIRAEKQLPNESSPSLSLPAKEQIEMFDLLPGLYFDLNENLVLLEDIESDKQSLDGEGCLTMKPIAEKIEVIDFLSGLYYRELVLPRENEDSIQPEKQSLNGESCVQVPLATLYTEECALLPGQFFVETVISLKNEDRLHDADRQSLSGESCVVVPLATLHTEELFFLPGLYFAETFIPHKSAERSNVDIDRQSLNGESCVLVPLATLHTEEYNLLPGLYFTETTVSQVNEDKLIDADTQSLNGESVVVIPLATVHTEEFDIMPGLYFIEAIASADKHTDIDTQSLNGESVVVIPLATVHTEEFDIMPGLYFIEAIASADKHTDIDTQSLNGESVVVIPLATVHTEEFDIMPGLYFIETVINNANDAEKQSLNGESCMVVPMATLHTEEWQLLPGQYFTEHSVSHDDIMESDKQSVNGGGVTIDLVEECVAVYGLLPGRYVSDSSPPDCEPGNDEPINSDMCDVVEESLVDAEVIKEQVVSFESCATEPEIIAKETVENVDLMSGLYFVETLVLAKEVERVEKKSASGEGCTLLPEIDESVEEFYFLPERCFIETLLLPPDNENIERKSVSGPGCGVLPEVEERLEKIYYLQGCYFVEAKTSSSSEADVIERKSVSGEDCSPIQPVAENLETFYFLSGCYFIETSMSPVDSEEVENKLQSGEGCVLLPEVVETVEVLHFMPGRYFDETLLLVPDDDFIESELVSDLGCMLLPEKVENAETLYCLPERCFAETIAVAESIEKKSVSGEGCILMPEIVENIEEFYFLSGRYFSETLLLPLNVDFVEKRAISGEGCVLLPDVTETVETFDYLPERCFVESDEEAIERKSMSGEGSVQLAETVDYDEVYDSLQGRYFAKDSSSSSEEDNASEISEYKTVVFQSKQEHDRPVYGASDNEDIETVSIGDVFRVTIPLITENVVVLHFLPGRYFRWYASTSSDDSFDRAEETSSNDVLCFAVPSITENVEICDTLLEKEIIKRKASYNNIAGEMVLPVTAPESVEAIQPALSVSYVTANISEVTDHEELTSSEGCHLLPDSVERIEEFSYLPARYFIDRSTVSREESSSSESTEEAEVGALSKFVAERVETLYFLSGCYFTEQRIKKPEINIVEKRAVSGEGLTLLPEVVERVETIYHFQGRYFVETASMLPNMEEKRQTSASGEGCVLIPETIEHAETLYRLRGKYFVEAAVDVEAGDDEMSIASSDYVIVPTVAGSIESLPERYGEEILLRENKFAERGSVSAELSSLSVRHSAEVIHTLPGRYFVDTSARGSYQREMDNVTVSAVNVESCSTSPSGLNNSELAHSLIERYGVDNVSSSESDSEDDRSKKFEIIAGNQSTREWELVVDERGSVLSTVKERAEVYYFMSGRYFSEIALTVRMESTEEETYNLSTILNRSVSDAELPAQSSSTKYVEVLYILPGRYYVELVSSANIAKLHKESVSNEGNTLVPTITKTETMLQSLPTKQFTDDTSSDSHEEESSYILSERNEITSETVYFLTEKYWTEEPLETGLDRKVSEGEAPTTSFSTREGTSSTLDDSDSLFGSAFSFLRTYNTANKSASLSKQQPIEEMDQMTVRPRSSAREESVTVYYLPARAIRSDGSSRRRKSLSSDSGSDSDCESEYRGVASDDIVLKSVAVGEHSEIVYGLHERYFSTSRNAETDGISVIEDVLPMEDLKFKEKSILAESFNSDVFADYTYHEQILAVIEGKLFISRNIRRNTESLSSRSSIRSFLGRTDSRRSLYELGMGSAELAGRSPLHENVEYVTAADKVFREVVVPFDDSKARKTKAKKKQQRKYLSRSYASGMNYAAASHNHLNDYDGDLLLYLLADQKGMRWKIIEQLHKTRAPRQVTYFVDVANEAKGQSGGFSDSELKNSVYVLDEQYDEVRGNVSGSRIDDSGGLAVAATASVDDLRSRTHMQRDHSTSSTATTLSVRSNGRPMLESSNKTHHLSGDSEREDPLASSQRSISDVPRRPSPRLPRSPAVEAVKSQNTTSASSVDSLASSSSLGGGATSVTGDIEMSVSYDYGAGCLLVHICRCRQLLAADSKRKRLDLYAKTYLLPDKSKTGKRRTKTIKNTADPMFDEVLRYDVSRSVLDSRVLWTSVWHKEQFGRNEFLGEVSLPLVDTNVDGGDVPRWYKLQSKPCSDEENTLSAAMMAYKGDLHLSIKFSCSEGLPTSVSRGDLHVLVHAAHNLTPPRITSSLNPYCKGCLLPDRSKTAQQKTPVVRRDCNPKWQHEFVFRDISLAQLHTDRCLELTVWNQGSTNDFLGGVRIGIGGKSQAKETVEWQDSTVEESRLWQAMLDRANQWIEGMLLLRPHVDRRK